MPMAAQVDSQPEEEQEQAVNQVYSSNSNQGNKRKSSWLLLAAQFLGLQLREVVQRKCVNIISLSGEGGSD